jgi:hypothetical protein
LRKGIVPPKAESWNASGRQREGIVCGWRKANETGSAKESAEEEEAPADLISTEVQTPPAPDWQDVPDGIAALYREGCKQQPGHSSDMIDIFALSIRGRQPLNKSLRAYDLHALNFKQFQKKGVGRNQVI